MLKSQSNGSILKFSYNYQRIFMGVNTRNLFKFLICLIIRNQLFLFMIYHKTYSSHRQYVKHSSSVGFVRLRNVTS